MFEFADKYRAAYSNGLRKVVCPFYCSFSGYQVNILSLFNFFIVVSVISELKSLFGVLILF